MTVRIESMNDGRVTGEPAERVDESQRIMACWNEDMVRFMAAASEWGDYDVKVADLLSGYLQPAYNVCDAGCGLGYLSLAMAPLVHSVEAVDINDAALDVLRGNCVQRGVTNVSVRQDDAKTMTPNDPFDAMVFGFFGRVDEILTMARRQCDGWVLILKKNNLSHRFTMNGRSYAKSSFQEAVCLLKGMGIPFRQRELEYELGQPLRGMDDVRCFFETYSCDKNPLLVEDSYLRTRLVETGREDYPLYLPHRRQFGLIAIRTCDIPFG